jgi:hypothetical protein
MIMYSIEDFYEVHVLSVQKDDLHTKNIILASKKACKSKTSPEVFIII